MLRQTEGMGNCEIPRLTSHWSRRQQPPLVPRCGCWRGSPRALGPAGVRETQDTGGAMPPSQAGPGTTENPQDTGDPRQHTTKTGDAQDRDGPRHRTSKTAPPQPSHAGTTPALASRPLGTGAGAKAGQGRARSPGRGLTRACKRRQGARLVVGRRGAVPLPGAPEAWRSCAKRSLAFLTG